MSAVLLLKLFLGLTAQLEAHELEVGPRPAPVVAVPRGQDRVGELVKHDELPAQGAVAVTGGPLAHAPCREADVTPHYFPTVGATRAAVADHAAGEILHAALDEGGEAALEPLGFHQGTDVAGNLSDVVE